MTITKARTIDWVLAWTLWALRRGYKNSATKGVFNIVDISQKTTEVGMPCGARYPPEGE